MHRWSLTLFVIRLVQIDPVGIADMTPTVPDRSRRRRSTIAPQPPPICKYNEPQIKTTPSKQVGRFQYGMNQNS